MKARGGKSFENSRTRCQFSAAAARRGRRSSIRSRRPGYPESQLTAIERAAEQAGGCRLDEVILAAAALAFAPHGWSVQAGIARSRLSPIGPSLQGPQDALKLAKAVLRRSESNDRRADVLVQSSPGFFACVRQSALEAPILPDGLPAGLTSSNGHKVSLQWWRDPDGGGLYFDGWAEADEVAASVRDVVRAVKEIARYCSSAPSAAYSVSDFPHIQLEQQDLDQLVARFATAREDLS